MATPRGTLRVCQDGEAMTFLVEGEGTMHHGLPLRRLGELALASGVTALRVDLRRCTYMDSTFVGTLLCLKRAAEGRGELALISPSPECRRLLEQMGIDRVLPIAAADEPAGPWAELKGDMEDLQTFKGNVVRAHQELANLPGRAGEAFREAARLLTEEWEAGRQR
jgi:anti-anti-sigma factor